MITRTPFSATNGCRQKRQYSGGDTTQKSDKDMNKRIDKFSWM